MGYVLIEQHGNYVSKIKQDCMPSEPSEHNEIGVLFWKETIPRNTLWSNTFVDENATIDLIMNAVTPAKPTLHILQQGLSKGTLSFETLD